MFGVGVSHGKFGELLQGVLPHKNTNFLVTLPIKRYSVVEFHCNAHDTNAIIYPPHKTKAFSLVTKVMEYFGLSCGWKLTIDSELEEGKGLGSSTADMVACARAISQATGRGLSIEVFLEFLREIEPSDGVMYNGVTCFYHRKVSLHSQLDYLSELMVVGVDEGGVVDTIKFNQESRLCSADEKHEYSKLLDEMISAIKKKDLSKVGSIATRSAILHQKNQPKKNLSFLTDLSHTVEALGVVVAHSGTYIGIALDGNHPNYVKQLSFVESKLLEHSLIPERFSAISRDNKQTEYDKGFLRTENVC